MATRGFLVRDQVRPVRYSSTKQSRTIKRKKKKPEWDSSINDLNVHKATKEEQVKRHEIHKSRNVTKGSRKRDKSNDVQLQTPDTAERRKLAIVHEVLYGEGKDILSRSDRAMSVARDLFGDDPKKYAGFPNITTAPSNLSQSTENKLVVGPVSVQPETPTHLSMLSDSVMRTPALNELSNDSIDDADEDSSPGSAAENDRGTGGAVQQQVFESKLDLQRFHKYVAEERRKHIDQDDQEHVIHLQASVGGAANVGDHLESVSGGSSLIHEVPHGKVGLEANTQPSSFLSQDSVETVVASAPTFVRPAIPSTGRESTTSDNVVIHNMPSKQGKVKETNSQVECSKGKVTSKYGDKQPANPSTSGLQSLEDFKKMVDALENEISEYECETGREPTRLSAISGNFSGYTAALITAITKLMAYLKESEVQKRAEMAMRDEILQGFAEQRALVDALTNDILHTQEENLALQQAFLEYRRETDEQLQYLKKELYAVLRSHEYQALSSSINSLYKLNAVSQRGKEESTSFHEERHNFEYLPKVPATQPGIDGKRLSETKGPDMKSTLNQLKEPTFIPVATVHNDDAQKTSPQQHAWHNLQGHVYSDSVQLATNISSRAGTSGQYCYETDPKIPHLDEYQQPHMGSSSQFVQHELGINHPTAGHVLLGSDIHLYPPRRATNEGTIDVGVHDMPSVLHSVSTKLPVETCLPSSHQGGCQYNPATNMPERSCAIAKTSSDQHIIPPQGHSISHNVSQLRTQTIPSRYFTDPRSVKPVGHTNSYLYNPNQGVHASNTTKSSDVGCLPFNDTQLQPQNEESHPQISRAKEHLVPSAQQLHQAPNTCSGTTTTSTYRGTLVPPPQELDLPCVTVPSVNPTNRNTLIGLPEPLNVRLSGQLRGFAPVSRAVIGGPTSNQQLRDRFQNLINKQKGFAADRGSQDAGSEMQKTNDRVVDTGKVQEQQSARSSPHVHFQEPLVVRGKEQGQYSPPVSPIPYKAPSTAQSSTIPSEKRVVLKLPNAWSDVSSTISL